MAKRIRPTKIRIEGMSVCQLRCPLCPTTTKEIQPTISPGYLKIGDFTDLLRRNRRIKHVELSNFGEILLSPDLMAIMKLADERGVLLTADNGLNMNTATDELLEGMVRFGFRSATISIDGATPESYVTYRVGGDFEAVIENLRKLNTYKKKYGSKYPVLSWQFIVFGHNEADLPRARELAKELDMVFCPKLSYDEEYSPLEDESFVRSQLDESVSSRSEYLDRYDRHYASDICRQLWREPQINWDGKVLGCCINYWGEFGGNAFTDGLEESINGERIEYARQMLFGRKKSRTDIPCTRCSVYKSMEKSGRWQSMLKIRYGSRPLSGMLAALYAFSRLKPLVRFIRRRIS